MSFVGKLLLRRHRHQSVTTLFPDQADFFGVGRYSIEAWTVIASIQRECRRLGASCEEPLVGCAARTIFPEELFNWYSRI